MRAGSCKRAPARQLAAIGRSTSGRYLGRCNASVQG